MDFSLMNVDEIIKYFCEKHECGEKFSLKELRDAAKACSVTDPIANADAVTIFYSGGEDEIANALASSNNENIRVIRRTDRFKLLAYEDAYGNSFDTWVREAITHENPGIGDELDNRLIQELYGVSDAGTDITEVGNGFWSHASADFAAETKRNAYALTGNDTYIFNLGDGADTIYDYENSTTSGREDRIVFGEGITEESTSIERSGDNLVIKYSGTDSVTVKNAYSYADGRLFVENIEFSGTAVGNIDYENVQINNTEQIIDDNLNNISNDFKDSGSEDVDYGTEELIDNCSELINNLDVDKQSCAEAGIEQTYLTEEANNIYCDDSEYLADNMANLLIQDMSESVADNITSTCEVSLPTTGNENVQLWVS